MLQLKVWQSIWHLTPKNCRPFFAATKKLREELFYFRHFRMDEAKNDSIFYGATTLDPAILKLMD